MSVSGDRIAIVTHLRRVTTELRVSDSLLLFFLILCLAPLVCVAAEDISFSVVEVDGTQVILTGSSSCAPGTLLNMQKRDANGRLLTLEIIAHRRDGSYVAVGASQQDNVGGLRVGDKGVTSSPQFFHKPMEVVVSPGDLPATRTVKDALTSTTVHVLDEVDAGTETARVALRRTGGNLSYKISSSLGVEPEQGGSIDEVKDSVLADSYAFYWITLHNPLVDREARFTNQKILPVNSTDFNLDGSLSVGKPIALQLLPPIEGFLSLLMVEPRGRITVLFPNDEPDAKWNVRATASVPYDFNTLTRLDLKATGAGPTIFVLLVSSSPRPLSAFMTSDVRGTFLKFDGKTPVDPDTIGPGWLNRTAESADSVEDSPETWAAYNVVLNVVAPETLK